MKSVSPPANEPVIVPLVTPASQTPASMLRREPDNSRRPMTDETVVEDVRAPAHYINRELSFLEFNHRVLEQARDATVPLLERVRFLAISCANLDEFFEIRVAGLEQRLDAGSVAPGADGLGVREQLAAIHERATRLVREQYRILNNEIQPALSDAGITILQGARTTPAQHEFLRRYFNDQVEPVLSPLALDPAHPFPRIQNKSLNFIVRLSGTDAFGRRGALVVLQAPRSLPRVIAVPGATPPGAQAIYLSTIIQTFVAELFPGLKVEGCYQFRVTRNSDLLVEEEEAEDLLRAVKGELASRRYGDEVRLETSYDCPKDIVEFLLEQFSLAPEDLFQVEGPVNLNRLMGLYDLIDRPDLKYPPFTPGIPQALRGVDDMFAAIRTRDILLHHPFESFAPVVDFLRQAASDPQVLAIKQTLYRAGNDSSIVSALVDAARAGKDVTVVVELRARFDEAANIEVATQLQAAGAHVVYGVVGFKTHAKLLMVVRREHGELRRYCHLGTGNYHVSTARVYTDYGLLTADRDLGEDVHDVFMQLTGLARTPTLRRALQSPFTLHEGLLSRIAREADNARAGRAAHLIAKMNALVEPQVIAALYDASRAGVQIDLIVRGICALRPGVPGVSETINVRSIVGRFLEHSRVFYFHNDGNEELFCSSADWMERNLHRRVEVCFPIDDAAHRARILEDLDRYLEDNTLAWKLEPNGEFKRLAPGANPPRNAQNELLTRDATP
ncbi:MAG TPA: polyphosphate kinase 1 [Steroidobacteraceae bacterium]|nr:polyphosphate kinase 1 [Steroidobacteraceae bacterium]